MARGFVAPGLSAPVFATSVGTGNAMLLRTLGGLSLQGTDFRRPKPLFLLAFLALEGTHDRRYLAELFWPNAADPRQSLTVALSQIHAAAPNLVHSDGSSVYTGVSCDAVQLREAATIHDWVRVDKLFEGRFLAGTDADTGNLELEEWLYATRELLEVAAQTAAMELAELSLVKGDYVNAGRLADRAATLALGAGSEAPRMERLHALLAATHSPRLGALRREAQALGIPLPEYRAEARQVARHSLPSDLTPFVGRAGELADLQTLLAEGRRLLTITGLGGMGKTRLALELARRLARTGRYGQIHHVPLGGAPTDDQLAPLLAAKLDRPDRGRRATDRAQGLAGPGGALLLLDDLDPSPAAREQLEALLQGAPDLDIVVTARQPLGSVAETQFQLAGLDLSQRTAGTDAASDALALYLQTAKQFDPTSEPDAASALQICALVAGSPLAIELAAALSRVLPTSELLQELRVTLDVLAEAQGGMPPRHQSVRAIFDSSWARLGAGERRALASCAIFHGGFSRAAARVLGLEVQLLNALLERSLLRRQGSRFELHPLVQQYAREKLDDYEEAEQWREEHAAYYTAWFASKRPFDQRSGQRQALEELALDFPNLQAAWEWAAGAGRTDLLERAIFMTARFLILRGRTSELERLLHMAGKVAVQHPPLRAQVLRWRAALAGWHDPIGAKRMLAEALDIHEDLGRTGDLGALHYHLGLVSAFEGDDGAARRHWRAAIPLLEEQDHEELLGSAYSNLSLVTDMAAEHEALARRAHAICVERGASAQLAICLANEAGQAHYAYGDSATAVRKMETAISLEKREGGRQDHLERFYYRQAYELVNLGQLTRAEERLAAAYKLIEERRASSYIEQGLFPPIELTAAQLHDARGEPEAARRTAEKAPNDRLCRETLCRLALDAGDADLAERHLAVLRTLRGYGFVVRARLHELAVERLLTGEVARARRELAAAEDQPSSLHLRIVASRALKAALDAALAYTFLPLALEIFTAACALQADLCDQPALALAAHHPASRYFVRRRALAMLPDALTPETEKVLAKWLAVPPKKLGPIVTDLAHDLGDRLAVALQAR